MSHRRRAALQSSAGSNCLQDAARRRVRRVIGLNSGTSADAIDVVLLEVRGEGWSSRLRALRFQSVPFPPPIAELLGGLLCNMTGPRSKRGIPPETLCRMDRLLGQAMGQAARRMRLWSERRGLRCHLVGSHGQTVWHGPRDGLSATLQLGHPASISQISGLPVVADFRQADVAAGGEGAPLTPAFDYLLFRSAQRDTVCLNLGGVANITAVPSGGRPSEVVGFDVGPCNILLDGLCHLLVGRRYDKGGAMAREGRPDARIADEFLKDSFFRQPPPRSTGRERYGGDFVRRFATRAKRGRSDAADTLATASLFVARSIARALGRFIVGPFAPDRVVVSGGGYHNSALRAHLKAELGTLRLKVLPFGEVGLNPDSKEAGLFAWLASEAVCGRKAHLPQVTGAREARVLGVLCP